MWEFVQGFGSLIGLATGFFVLWERVTRHWPAFIFVSKKHPEFETGAQLLLRVYNRSERPLMVDVHNCDGIGRFRISKDDTPNSLIQAYHGTKAELMVDAQSVAEFPVLPPFNWDNLSDDYLVCLTVYWSFPQGGSWQFRRRRRICLHKRNFNKMSYIW